MAEALMIQAFYILELSAVPISLKDPFTTCQGVSLSFFQYPISSYFLVCHHFRRKRPRKWSLGGILWVLSVWKYHSPPSYLIASTELHSSHAALLAGCYWNMKDTLLPLAFFICICCMLSSPASFRSCSNIIFSVTILYKLSTHYSPPTSHFTLFP